MKKSLTFLAVLMCYGYTQAQLTDGSKLKFTYDTSGNQMLRDVSTASRANESLTEEPEILLDEFTISEKESIENAFTVSPNPTAGRVTLQWKAEFSEQITSIELVSLITSERSPIAYSRGNSASIDITGKVTGLYLVVFHLNNTAVASVQKKLIKL